MTNLDLFPAYCVQLYYLPGWDMYYYRDEFDQVVLVYAAGGNDDS